MKVDILTRQGQYELYVDGRLDSSYDSMAEALTAMKNVKAEKKEQNESEA